MLIDIIVGILSVGFIVFIIARNIIRYKRKGLESLGCGDCSKCSKNCVGRIINQDEQGK